MDIRLTPNGNDLCYETYYGTYFRSSYSALLETMYNMNGRMTFHGTVTMDDIYRSLCVEKPKDANCVGWVDEFFSLFLEQPPWIDFYISTKIAPNGEPCLHLNYMHKPILLGEWETYSEKNFF